MFEENVLETGINQNDPIKQSTLTDIRPKAEPSIKLNLPPLEKVSSPSTPEVQAYPTQEPSTPITDIGKDYDFNIRTMDGIRASASQWGTVHVAKGAYFDNFMDRENTFGETDYNFNLVDALKETGMKLDEAEYKFLNDRGLRNKAEFDYFIEELKENREDRKVMGQFPVSTFVTQALDPMYLVGGYGAGKLAQLGKLTRMQSVASSLASDVALGSMEVYYDPTYATSDLAGSAIMGLAFGTAFSRPHGKIETKTTPKESITKVWENADFEITNKYNSPTYMGTKGSEIKFDPSGKAYTKDSPKIVVDTPENVQTVSRIRQETKALNGDFDPNIQSWRGLKEGWEMNTGKDGLPNMSHIDFEARNKAGVPLKSTAFYAVYKVAEDAKVSKAIRELARYQLKVGANSLQNTKLKFASVSGRSAEGKITFGRYGVGQDTVQINSVKGHEGRVPFTTNHEAMHSLTAHKIEYGKRNPNSAHGIVVRQIDDLAKHVREEIHKSQIYKESTRQERFAMDYAVKNAHEFMSALAEIGSPKLAKFKGLLDSIEVPARLKDAGNPNATSALRYLMDSLRKLLGLDINEANALYKGLQLQDTLLKTPEVKITLPDGSVGIANPKSSNFHKEVVDLTLKEVQELETMASKAGNKIAWNGFKAVTSWGEGGRNFARLFMSDPLGSNPNNIQSIKQGLSTDYIDRFRVPYENELNMMYKEAGFTWYDRIFKPAKIQEFQNKVSRELTDALVHIEEGIPNPKSYSPRMQRIIDLVNEMGIKAGRDLVDAGLLPKEILNKNGGFFPRRWNSNKFLDIIDRIQRSSDMDYGEAKNYLARQFANSIKYDVDDATKFLMARTLIDHTIDKADQVDLVFRGHIGNEAVKVVRDNLEKYGTNPEAIQKVIDTLTGVREQAGKESWQKKRMDLDQLSEIYLPDGHTMSVKDFIDADNIFPTLDRYMEDTAGRRAMAQKGIMNQVDLDKIVEEAKKDAIRKGIPASWANQVIDGTVNTVMGRPVGEAMATPLRLVSAFTQMVGLRNSGFWQVTELAKAFQKGIMTVGIKDTTSAFFKAFGDIRKGKDPNLARDLNHILSRKSYNEVRMRPLVQRYTDGHMDSSPLMRGVQQAQGMVYYVNGMVYVQQAQSHFAGNLLTTSLHKAVEGDPKLVKYFERYGIGAETLSEVREQINLHGLKVDDWDAKVWMKVNPVLTEIMDTDVLRSKTGEVPLLFQFSEAGKVLGTFMNFTFTAHNKILANTLTNEGIKAAALLLSIQVPMAMLMTQISSVSAGRGWIEDPIQWLNASIGVAGSFGLFAEIYKIVTGNAMDYGGSFTMSLNKLADTIGSATTGNFGRATDSLVKSVPLLSLLPAYGLAYETMKSIGGSVVED